MNEETFWLQYSEGDDTAPNDFDLADKTMKKARLTGAAIKKFTYS